MSSRKYTKKSSYRPLDAPVKEAEKVTKYEVPFYKGRNFNQDKAVTNQQRTNIFAMMKDPVMQARNNLYTRMCNFSAEECPDTIHCIFAHSKEQLRKQKCWFGKCCKKSAKECDWDHDENHVIPEMPPAKPVIKHEEFIIPFCDSDVSDEEVEEADREIEENIDQVNLKAEEAKMRKFIEEEIRGEHKLPKLSREEQAIIKAEHEDRDKWAIANPLKPWTQYVPSPCISPCVEEIINATVQEHNANIPTVITLTRKERKQRQVVLDVFMDDDEYLELLSKIKKIAL